MSTGTTSAEIHLGAWIDWSKGAILGSTVTVTAQNGAFLVAFLALFVQLAGSHLWDLVNGISHRCYVTSKPRDPIYWQQQVILRNSLTPAMTFWDLMKVSWAWRSRPGRVSLRTLPVALVALLYVIGFSLAGIFASQMVTTANIAALVSSKYCGFWQLQYGMLSPDSQTAWMRMNMNTITSSTQYSRACYKGNKVAGRPQCNVFAKRQIDWTSDYNATCPFAAGTCIGTNTAALQLDTGPIDSHYDLGIDAKKEDRVTYRRVTTCAPLKPIYQWKNATESKYIRKTLPGEMFAEFDYGPQSLDYNFTWRTSSYGIWETLTYTL